MHRRVWFLAAAAAAVLALAGSAAATSDRAAAADARQRPPFAKAWASAADASGPQRRRRPSPSRMEQDAGGTLNLANQDFQHARLGGVVRQNADPARQLPRSRTSASTSSTSRRRSRPPRSTSGSRSGRTPTGTGVGKTLPVTYKDYVYTWKPLNNPDNDVATNVGVNQIGRLYAQGKKEVTFYWKKNGQASLGGSKAAKDRKCTQDAPCGPFADYRDLSASSTRQSPSRGRSSTRLAQLRLRQERQARLNGPYLMTSYTKGQGVTLKANPKWYGHKPSIKTVNFKLYTQTNSEVQAIRSGEVDAAAPQPTPALSSITHVSGIHYHVAPGNSWSTSTSSRVRQPD